MYNRRYDKVFVMLRQEMNGFAAGQRPAWGSCTMEIKNGKGRLAATVQGLKKLTEDRSYVFYVVAGKTGQAEGIVCCPLEIDDYGKGEIKWEFDPDNIAGTGYIAEELHTVALLVKGRDDYGLIAPLAGYFDEKINWKNRFQEKTIPEISLHSPSDAPLELLKEEPILETVENEKPDVQEIQNENTEQSKERQAVEDIAPTENVAITSSETAALETPKNERKSTFQQAFSDMLSKFQQELTELEKQGVIKPEDRKRIDTAGLVVEKEEQPEINSELEYILIHNAEIIPFEEDSKKWRCIAMEELAVLPIDFLSMMRHTFFQLAYRKYKHFILGKDEMGKCYLGIPDTYQSENRRLAEGFGFLEFKPCAQNAMGENSYGYWMKWISGGKQ